MAGAGGRLKCRRVGALIRTADGESVVTAVGLGSQMNTVAGPLNITAAGSKPRPGVGPGAYALVNVVDFGADNFARCGACVMNRGSYVNIFEKTTNITNTSYVNIVNQNNQKYVNIYNGGPNPKWVNKERQKAGRKEM